MGSDLGKVLAYDENICQKIEENDKTLKELVYSNYTKFVQVTETITKIRHEAESFDNDLATISKSLNDLTVNYNTIHSTLTPLRKELISLHQKQKQIEQQQDFLDFPDQLRLFLTESRWIEFAELYSSKRPELKQNAHIKAFESILNDVDSAAARAEKNLRTITTSDIIDPHTSINAFTALSHLHPEDCDTIAKDCITALSKYLNRLISTSFSTPSSEPAHFLATVATTVVNALNVSCESYISLNDRAPTNFFDSANVIVGKTAAIGPSQVVSALRGIADAAGKIKTLHQYGDYAPLAESAIENATRKAIEELSIKAAIDSIEVLDSVSVEAELCVTRGYVGFSSLAEKREKQIESAQLILTEKIAGVLSIAKVGKVNPTWITNCLANILVRFIDKIWEITKNKNAAYQIYQKQLWPLFIQMKKYLMNLLLINIIPLPNQLILTFCDVTSTELYKGFSELFSLSHPSLPSPPIVRPAALQQSTLMVSVSNLLKVYFPDIPSNNRQTDYTNKSYFFDTDEPDNDIVLTRTSIIERIVVETMKKLRNDIPFAYNKIDGYITQITIRLESCCSEGALTAGNEISLIKEALIRINN
ncbi:Vacuolar protein sorting-associated protein 51-like protein [Entamoeba marina]